jgi:predicted nucleic acid-binding protein
MVDLILDTSYILPLFGIKIKISDTFDDELRRFWKNGLEGYKIFFSSMSLIEVIYLLNGEFRNIPNIEILERYPMVLPSVVNSSVVTMVDSIYDTEISKIANEIRMHGHKDVLDCYIAATAIERNGIFVSRDRDLKEVIQSMDKYKGQKIIKWNDVKKLSDFNKN